LIPPGHAPALDRRRLADRRAHPTTLWSAFRWQGRRTSFRRAGEGRSRYVDCLACRTVVLALLVCGGSLLDACLTLLHLEDGGREANPLMEMALAYGPTVFVALKLGITGVAVWVLAAHQQWRLATRGLYGLVLGYGTVLGYHLVLCFRWV
jgi:Domain of unknown function (DUF5658)